MTSVLLAWLAGLLGLAGVAGLSQATTGVGLISVGCLVAIFARLSQASRHHREMMGAIEKPSPLTTPAARSESTPEGDA